MLNMMTSFVFSLPYCLTRGLLTINVIKYTILGFGCLFATVLPAQVIDTARDIYQRYQDSIYQIRVIELSSGNKTSIGSGFLVSEQGLVATNYHVVSHLIQNPERYRLEYVAKDGQTNELRMIDIDVVHDLAIAASDISQPHFLPLGSAELSKGTRIFSLGNPRDLGMSVVEGTYNGLLDKTLYDKIFFSGSLNPGMSGGPTLDQQGHVVGINVSTAGNQLSFLVPVNYLKQLLHEVEQRSFVPVEDFHARIEQQLLDKQTQYLTELMNQPWESNPFGVALLPGKIADVFKCWGDADRDKKILIDHAYSQCKTEDRIFLDTDLSTGGIAYRYDLYTNKDLSSLHFYHLYQRHFGQTIRVNRVNKEAATNFSCHTEFVRIADQDWKMAFCTRHYTKYTALYDISVSIALVSEVDKGLMIQIAAAGVSKSLGLGFVKRFVEEIHWQN